MTAFFLDSSVLVKRYIREQGTVWVRSITRANAGYTLFVAQITPVEVMSGVFRQHREGIITGQLADVSSRLLQLHTQRDYVVVTLTPDIVRQSIDYLNLYALRAYDAVQLASAVEAAKRLGASEGDTLEFVSADKRLLAAAASVGLPVRNPITLT